MNLEDNKLVIGRNVKLLIDSQLKDKGVITDTEIAIGTNQPRIQIEIEDSKQKQNIWLGYVDRDDLEPGWRCLFPDPLISNLLTFSTRGPIYEIIPTI